MLLLHPDAMMHNLVRHDVVPEVRHDVVPEVHRVIPEVRHVVPEAYCYRSYCYNMHLDPGQQAPSCTSLPEEVHHYDASVLHLRSNQLHPCYGPDLLNWHSLLRLYRSSLPYN